jgi:S1-C subfamily serine protease
MQIKDAKTSAAADDLLRQAAERKSCAVAVQRPAGEKMSPEKIYAAARQSVVIVGKLYKCRVHNDWHPITATGIVLTKDGVIATNYHVVESDTPIVAFGIMTADGRVFPVTEVLAASQPDDAAILKTGATDLTPLPVAQDVAVGAAAYCLSHVNEEFYTFTQGSVCAKVVHPVKKGQTAKRLAISADYAKGSSGGPVLNDCGAVIGMVASTMPIYYSKGKNGEQQNIQMVWKHCVPAESLLALLKQ